VRYAFLAVLVFGLIYRPASPFCPAGRKAAEKRWDKGGRRPQVHAYRLGFALRAVPLRVAFIFFLLAQV